MRLFMLLAVLACTQLQAATVVKCKDATGHITFTQSFCPDAGVGEAVDVQNTRPSGAGEGVRMAPKYVAPRVTYAAPVVVEPVAAEVAEAPVERVTNTPSRGGTVARQRPKVIMVDQRYNYTQKMKNGTTRGVSGIRKVPVLAR